MSFRIPRLCPSLEITQAVPTYRLSLGWITTCGGKRCRAYYFLLLYEKGRKAFAAVVYHVVIHVVSLHDTSSGAGQGLPRGEVYLLSRKSVYAHRCAIV